ncbi:MAG TPA: SRPBCC family protein [Candidatus Obscuribacterales bacterium]
MQEFTAEVTIRQPVARVFTWLTTAGNHPKWDKSSLGMECLTPGPWKKGTCFREQRLMGSRKVDVLSEIIAFKPNELFVVKSRTGPGWLGTWQFHDIPEGTRLKWSAQFRMYGIGRLFEGLIAGKIRKAIGPQFGALPAIIEAELNESEADITS